MFRSTYDVPTLHDVRLAVFALYLTESRQEAPRDRSAPARLGILDDVLEFICDSCRWLLFLRRRTDLPRVNAATQQAGDNGIRDGRPAVWAIIVTVHMVRVWCRINGNRLAIVPSTSNLDV